MAERSGEKTELLQQFALNRTRSKLRAYIPFGATFGPSAVGYMAAESSGTVTNLLEQASAGHSELLIPVTAIMLVSGIGTAVQTLEIARVNSTNGKIAQEIARIDGRDPQTTVEKRRELNRVRNTVKTAENVSPTPINILDLWLRHKWAKLRRERKPESMEEFGVANGKIRRWAAKYSPVDALGYQVKAPILRDALMLADKQWESFVQNEKKPEYQRRHGALMRTGIQKRLSELPTSEVPQEPENPYEKLTPHERDRQFKKLILQFPDKVDWRDNSEIDARKDSAEKKALFAQIRLMLATAPTTRAFREILQGELSLSYDMGIEHSGSDVRFMAEWLKEAGLNVEEIDEPEVLEALGFSADKIWNLQNIRPIPLLNEDVFRAIGMDRSREGSDDSLLFDDKNVQETERRFYGYRRARNKEVYGRVLHRITKPRLEESWVWEYRAKYKQKLKPLQ